MGKEYNFWVYVLTNWKKTVLYVGVTNDLSRRLIEHYANRGKPKTFAGRYYCYNLVLLRVVSVRFECACAREGTQKNAQKRKRSAHRSSEPRLEVFQRFYMRRVASEEFVTVDVFTKQQSGAGSIFQTISSMCAWMLRVMRPSGRSFSSPPNGSSISSAINSRLAST